MSVYTILEATAADNEELCSLCGIPSQGDIRLAFERRPDFFANARIQCEESVTYVCRRNGQPQILGVFTTGKRRVFVNGEICRFNYLSDLKIAPNARSSGLLYRICRFIADNILTEGSGQAIVFADNEVMLRLVERLGRRSEKMSIFNFFPAGNYLSYMLKLPFKKPGRHSLTIRRAEDDDIPAMQDFFMAEAPKKQFYPFYDFRRLSGEYYKGLTIRDFYLAFSGSELKGIAGVWDQKLFKQLRVQGYSARINFLRRGINFAARLSGGFELPPAGSFLNYLNIHSILVAGNEPEVFEGMLLQMGHHFKDSGYNYFLVGLDEKDNLNKAVKGFSRKRIIEGRHFIVSNQADLPAEMLSPVFYIEAARI